MSVARSLTLPTFRRRARPLWLRFRRPTLTFLTLFLANILFIALRGRADDTPVHHQRASVLDIERLLGGGRTPTERLQGWFYSGHAGPTEWFFVGVHASWYPVPLAMTLYILLIHKDRSQRYAAMWLCVLFASLILFFLLPTEPPWMAVGAHRITEVVRGVPLNADTNPLAAFPSLHVAVPAAQALWLREERMNRWALVFSVYTALVALAVVYLGEHYVVDAIAGVLLAFVVVRVYASVGVRAAHGRTALRGSSVPPDGSNTARTPTPSR
jgi:hypothetical protein